MYLLETVGSHVVMIAKSIDKPMTLDVWAIIHGIDNFWTCWDFWIV